MSRSISVSIHLQILLMLDQGLNGTDISETGMKPFTYRGSNLPSESLDPYFLRFHFLRHSAPSSGPSHWSESSPSYPLIGCSVHSSHPRASYLIKLKHSHLSYHLKSPRAATLSFLLFTDIAQTWSPALYCPGAFIHADAFKNHTLCCRGELSLLLM